MAKNNIKIGISVGDINGIGIEVILKSLYHSSILDICTPVIYGSTKVVDFHRKLTSVSDIQYKSIQHKEKIHIGRINVVNCWKEDLEIKLGEVCHMGGLYSQMSLDYAVTDLKNGFIDALVTAPIHKKAMNMSGFEFPGHTEYLTEEFGGGESLMLMVNEGLRIGLVTNHLPLGDVKSAITQKRIIEKMEIMNKTLRVDFGIEKPNIAVLGLNPHAGDEGVLGKEEIDIIRPAVLECKKRGIMAFGPFPADGFFGSNKFRKFDGILAMYHDQGLVPFKALSFGNGVNFTGGLNHVRTSPDHGTGMDIVGKDMANPGSFRQALFLAIDVARRRKDYAEMTSNPIVRKRKGSEDKGALADKF